jgi:hypothetical protein
METIARDFLSQSMGRYGSTVGGGGGGGGGGGAGDAGSTSSGALYQSTGRDHLASFREEVTRED